MGLSAPSTGKACGASPLRDSLRSPRSIAQFQALEPPPSPSLTLGFALGLLP